MKGGTNLGRSFYRRLDLALRRLARRKYPVARESDRRLRIGTLARKHGITPRQARRRLKATRRALRREIATGGAVLSPSVIVERVARALAR